LDGIGKVSLAHLRPVSETPVIPLWARSVESGRSNGILHDPQAERILPQLDYDVGKFRDAAVSQLTLCVRARTIDRWVSNFLRDNPAGTLVDLGTGLDTRFDRLDNGRATWFELDLPEVIALRRCFLRETRRRRFVADSVTDSPWIRRIKRTPGPYFFVAEGLLMYLRESDVKALFSRLADHFPGSPIAFDTFSPVIADNLAWHDTMRFMGAGFSWAIARVSDIEAWDSRCRVIESVGLEALHEYLHRLPLNQQMLLWILQCAPIYAVNLLQFVGNEAEGAFRGLPVRDDTAVG